VNPYWLLVLPFLAVVVALVSGPIANILWLSVTDPKPGLGNYAKVFESDSLVRIIMDHTANLRDHHHCQRGARLIVAYAVVHALAREQAWMLTFVLLSFWISVLVGRSLGSCCLATTAS
jgi:putative spermidine/putrescine transport system permease protein